MSIIATISSGASIIANIGTRSVYALDNSDASFSQSINKDTTLADINITKNDDSVVTSPSNIALDLGVIDPFPATWDEMVAEYGIGYNFPMTSGQTTVYRTGDDADIEATIFTAAVRAAMGLKPAQSLASSLVLNNNNAFGNTNRFTDDAGGQDHTNDYGIDHYTGIGWYMLAQTSDSFNDSIDAALASSQNGFTDWFAPNVNQLFSLRNQSSTGGTMYYNLVQNSVYGTTTTNPADTLFRMYLTSNFEHREIAKTSNRSYLLCRKHF